MKYEIQDAIVGIVGTDLNSDEAATLSAYLRCYIDGAKECGRAYTTVVDFLMGAGRITLFQRCDLLDLLG